MKIDLDLKDPYLKAGDYRPNKDKNELGQDLPIISYMEIVLQKDGC